MNQVIANAVRIARRKPAYARGGGTDYNRMLQQMLAQKGYYRANVDGVAGAKTHEALRAFQQEMGLKLTGTATKETLSALKAPPLPRLRPQPELVNPELTAGNKLGASAEGLMSVDQPDAPLPTPAPPSRFSGPFAGTGSDPNRGAAQWWRSIGLGSAQPDTPPAVAAAVRNAGARSPMAPHPNFAGKGLASDTPMDGGALQDAIAKRAASMNQTAGYAGGGVALMPGSLPGMRKGSLFQKGHNPGPAPTPYQPKASPSQPYAPKIGHVGGLLSPVAGRTDHIPLDVPDGAYVLPADVVSGLGQGNTLHGTKVADRMFHGTFRRPHPLALRRATSLHSSGGGVDTVPIMAAGGEYVVSPETVTTIGGGDVKRGHAVLDKFVEKVRGQTISTLKKLPGPVKS